MVTTVYVLRHCQSVGNIEGRFQGRFDSEISEAGRKQLELLSLRFRNEEIDAIYSSPLKRARYTAEAVNCFHNLTVQICQDLIEIDVGRMEDLKISEIAGKFPETARNWDVSPDLCQFPGGESMAQVYQRVNRALDRIISSNRGKKVVIATHGGVIRNLYARVQFGALEGIRQSAVFGNTGVSILEAKEDGGLSWKLINDQSHLPEELRRPPTKYSFHEAV